MGKTIVITGAGVGLGRALARCFAKEGDTTILLGRTFSKVQAVAQELGEPHFAVECDVGDPDSVRAAFARIAERHPKIDVLINNAAIYEPFLVRDATDEQITSIIGTNLTGTIFCCREAIPMMEKGAQIINVSSESVREPFAMLSLYQCSKSGVERFTETLEKELEPDGIRVCVLRAAPMVDADKDMPNWDPDVAMQFFEANLKLGRNLAEQPITQVDNVTCIFRALIDLPPDFKATHVSVGARHP